jgi:hypothetical protein
MKIEINKELSIYFTVKGYQFPGMTDDPYGYDMNWLNIEVKIKKGNKSWSQTDPFLLTFEIQGLAVWLQDIGKHRGEEWFCLENMLFIKNIESPDVPDGSYRLQLKMNDLKVLTDAGYNVFEKEFTSQEIAELVRELEKTLSRYPIRGDERIRKKIKSVLGTDK